MAATLSARNDNAKGGAGRIEKDDVIPGRLAAFLLRSRVLDKAMTE
jgi:hypothetical protein